MLNPIVGHKNIEDAILKYVGTAFGTASKTFEKERAENLRKDGVCLLYTSPSPRDRG